MSDFMNALEKRRSIYQISKESVLSRQEITDLTSRVLELVPTAYNNQSPRLMLLFGAEHDKFWDIVMEALREMVPADAFAPTQAKIEGFKIGHGTILFFDDTNVTKEYAETYTLYSDRFPVWAEQTNGMLQYAIWIALEDKGLGATLQHYNPLVDAKAAELFQIPSGWKLIAQMPYGNPVQWAGEKSGIPASERMIIKG